MVAVAVVEMHGDDDWSARRRRSGALLSTAHNNCLNRWQVLALWCVTAASQVSTPIPHRVPIARKVRFKGGFSSGSYGPYRLVSSNLADQTIVAMRNKNTPNTGRDGHTAKWIRSICSTALRDGTVRLPVELEL